MAQRLDVAPRHDAEPRLSAGRVEKVPEQPPGLGISPVSDNASTWWNDFVAGAAEASIYHRYEWRGIIERVFGKRSVYLAARDEAGRCRGVLPLVHMKSRLFGNYMVSMPYFNYGGAVADGPEVLRALVLRAEEHARAFDCAHIEFRHEGLDLLDLPVKTSKVSMLLALPASAEALWSTFKPKLRAQIRRPQKAGANVRIGGGELVNDFYGVFAANMRDLGTPVYSRGFFREILATFQDARVAVVEMGGAPVAAGIVLGAGERLEIPWASSLRSHNRFSPNMLLYWSLLEWAIGRGYKTFDFGRCTRGSGTHRFKEQWGATEYPLAWYYWTRDGGPLPELNPDNPKYAMLVRTWQKLPIPLTRLIGPHIVKHLP